MAVAMLGYLISISTDFYDFISSFSKFSLLVSIETTYQTLQTVSDHISKIFNYLLGVWKCGQTPSFVLDISRKNCSIALTTADFCAVFKERKPCLLTVPLDKCLEIF